MCWSTGVALAHSDHHNSEGFRCLYLERTDSNLGITPSSLQRQMLRHRILSSPGSPSPMTDRAKLTHGFYKMPSRSLHVHLAEPSLPNSDGTTSVDRGPSLPGPSHHLLLPNTSTRLSDIRSSRHDLRCMASLPNAGGRRPKSGIPRGLLGCV